MLTDSPASVAHVAGALRTTHTLPGVMYWQLCPVCRAMPGHRRGVSGAVVGWQLFAATFMQLRADWGSLADGRATLAHPVPSQCSVPADQAPLPPKGAMDGG